MRCAYNIIYCVTHTVRVDVGGAQIFIVPVCAKIILKVVLIKYIKHRILCTLHIHCLLYYIIMLDNEIVTDCPV